jgi:endoglucanase
MYKRDGNEQSVNDKLQIVKGMGQINMMCQLFAANMAYITNTPIWIAAAGILRPCGRPEKLGIPGMLWDYNTSFSIFTGKPSMDNLPACMKGTQ